jgi:hypothetical protein
LRPTDFVGLLCGVNALPMGFLFVFHINIFFV